MRFTTDDQDVNQRLTQILSSEKVSRNELIEVFLKHTKLQGAPNGLRKVFICFQDDTFATEVLQYLKEN